MQAHEVATLTLAAVLVGALLPLALQAWMTLRSAQRWLDHNGAELGQTLRELAQTSRAYGDMARDLEATIGQLRAPLATVSAISGAAVPALLAGLQALRSGHGAHGGDDGRRGNPTAVGRGGQPAQEEEHHE